jgi:drug/metabolite transporter (DMT)-like permease
MKFPDIELGPRPSWWRLIVATVAAVVVVLVLWEASGSATWAIVGTALAIGAAFVIDWQRSSG